MEKGPMEELNNKAKQERVQTRSALEILRIANSKKPDILEAKFDSFAVILGTFLKNNNPDWIIIKEISLIIENSNETSTGRVNSMIKSLILLLIKWHGTTQNEWFCACEQIINMIYTLKQNPEALLQYLILQCSKFLSLQNPNGNNFSTFPSQNMDSNSNHMEILGVPNENSMPFPVSPSHNHFNNDMMNTQRLEEELNHAVQEEGIKDANFEDRFTQTIFIIGHVAIKFLLHIDTLESYFKKLKIEAETKSQANQKDNQAECELDQISGGVEADLEHKIEKLHHIGEKFLVFKNLLGYYVPYIKGIVQEIIHKKQSTRNPLVERVVVLTLCKYMCTSSEFCEQNLTMLFGLLKHKIDPITKTNVIISLGDLIHRFPNVTEPYTSNLYQNLQDDDVNVRKTTLMVITHLILNDMLKLKSEVSDIALLFEDPDIKIQNLVKLFFHELHKKDTKIIYNLLPEAIGRLSRMPNVTEVIFQTFAKNVMQYMEKEKFSESLVEKLCYRFKNTDNEKEWRNTAYCLTQLSYNEKGLRKLIHMFEFYREKLLDQVVNEHYKTLLTKLKKFMKQETKTLIDEFESKLVNFMKDDGDRKRKVPEKKTKGKKGGKGGGKKDDNEMEIEESKANKENMEEEDENGNSQQPRVIRKIKPIITSKSKGNSQKHKPQQRRSAGVEIVSSGPVVRERHVRAAKVGKPKNDFIVSDEEDDDDPEDDFGGEDYMEEEV
jgi:condensin complex subunit 1